MGVLFAIFYSNAAFSQEIFSLFDDSFLSRQNLITKTWIINTPTNLLPFEEQITSRRPEFIELASMFRANINFQCKNPEDCPEGLAKLIIIDLTPEKQTEPITKFEIKRTPLRIKSCTASLLPNGIMATNAHCIPEKLKVPGANCLGEIFVYFSTPHSGTPEMQTCLHMVGLAPESQNTVKPDYAYFKLLGVPNRKPFEISRNGFQENKNYYVYHHQEGSPEAPLVKKNCKLAPNSYPQPFPSHPKQPLIQFSDCPIGPSDSGAPIVDEENKWVGLIGGQIHPYFILKLSNELSSLKLLNSPPTFWGWGTNASCIADPTYLGPFSNQCNKLNDHLFLKSIPISDVLKSKLNDTYLTWTTQISKKHPEIEWGLKNISSQVALGLLYFPLPKCIKYSFGSDSSDSKDKKIKMKLPLWGLEVNSSLQHTGEIMTQSNQISLEIRESKYKIRFQNEPWQEKEINYCD